MLGMASPLLMQDTNLFKKCCWKLSGASRATGLNVQACAHNAELDEASRMLGMQESVRCMSVCACVDSTFLAQSADDWLAGSACWYLCTACLPRCDGQLA